ncbi:gem-associated protein 6-like isoform X2 [Macrobrachium nipponense]
MTDKHKIFTNDPVRQRALIHTRVEVTTTNKQTHIGWVYTVDPVSESAILVELGDENTAEVKFLSGYNISDITVIEDKPPPGLADTIDNLFRKKQVHYSSREIVERRESLCVWLAGNRVPYTIRDDLSIEVLQTAVIAPPYEPGSIQCTNEVVLDKVMKLVQQMPANS